MNSRLLNLAATVKNQFASRFVRAGAILLLVFATDAGLQAQDFVHPGGLFKQSDMDRMRAMVAAGAQPWTDSFNQLKADSKASYNYTVRGNPAWTTVSRDPCINCGAFESDANAAYFNALMWSITQDTRHADKCVEIFNAWKNLTDFRGGGTEPLNAGLFAWKLVEAAEIIQSTYSGWSAPDRQAFKDMLVYPGYSTNGVPASVNTTNGTFYWRIYKGDPGRHGNQDLIAWRAMIVMGVFLDNRVMYDRALRYFKGLPGRPDDIPMPTGPSPSGSVVSDNEYFTAYQYLGSQGTIPSYGYNGVLTNYVWESGQNQESSRDQQHAFFGLGICAGIAEVAWNQGDDVWNSSTNRLLLGFEFMARYNTSFIQSFPDQPAPWEPDNFIQRKDRTGRWFSKKMNPYFESNFTNLSRGNFAGNRPVYEQAVAHFQTRMGLTNESLWTERSRDVAIALSGYETTGFSLDHPGWGALTFRRPPLAAGDPIRGFTNGLPDFALHQLPGSIVAANYDHFPGNGEGRTYHDLSPGNVGGAYRSDAVDIALDAVEGPCLTDLESGEWLGYTVNVPAYGVYDISVRYAATNGAGLVRFAFGGTDVTGNISLPSTGAMANWTNRTVATNLALNPGAQVLRVFIGGASRAFQLRQFTITQTPAPPLPSGAHTWTNLNNGNASGSWGVAANWQNGSIASGADRVANFSSLDITTLSTVTLDGARTVGHLAFGDVSPSSNWALDAGTGGALTLSVTSNSPLVQVNNQTVTISTVLDGTRGLTKTGAGTLVLNSGASTYSGDSVIMSGIVRLGTGGSPLGASSISGSNTNRAIVLGGATLQLNPNVQVLTKQLHLSGDGVGGALGALYVNAAGTGTGTRWAHSGTINPGIVLDADATIRVDGDGSGASTADVLIGYTQLNGATLRKTGPGRLSFDRPGTSIIGPGILHVAEGVMGFVENQITSGIQVRVDNGAVIRGGRNPGPFRSAGNSLTLDGTWIVNARGSGVVGTDSTSNSELVGVLNGAGTITTGVFGNTNQQTITIQNDATHSDFSGTIMEANGRINLIKAGIRTMALSGNNSYSGTTTVSGGTLLVNGNHVGGGSYAINTGGTLGGSGVVASPVTIASGATLAPGASLGTLTISNDLTFSGNVAVEINKTTSTTNDHCIVTGTLLNAGAGSVIVSNLGPALVAGDVFSLFNKPVQNGAAMIITPSPGPNLIWTNRLAVDGTIAVVGTAAATPVQIEYSITSNALTLEWPTTHIGWRLQTQTNPIHTGLNLDWFDVAGAMLTNQVTFPIGAALGSVFFRLIYP